ncbi:hybrid sensor histidine kinase/response regulator [Metabacillus sp. Hm71]|uniref:hybrid sensor histidine kinase/response regulator n=1 Tax=Metabacillus sp. Hm71 TaxID=3450743 RepID=UPI003F436D46
MSFRKILAIIIFFIILLTSLRFVWFINHLPLNQPFVEKGIIDLSQLPLSDKSTVALDGEWTFYPNVFASPKDLAAVAEQNIIQVPRGWKELSTLANEKEQVGTYELRIHVQDDKEEYRLKVHRIADSFILYANGDKIEQRTAYSNTMSSLVPSILTVKPDKTGWIHLVIAVSSSDEIYDGGLLKSIRFGTESAITREHLTSLAMQLMVAAIMIIHGIYACILYFIRPKKIELLYFMVAVLLSSLSVLVSDDRLILQWIPLNYELFVKLAYLTYTGLSLFFLLFVRYLFTNDKRNHMVRWISGFCWLYGLFIALAPTTLIRGWSILLLFVLAIPFTAIILLVAQVIIKKEKDSLFLLLAAISVASSILWSSFAGRIHALNLGMISMIDPSFYPVDLTLAFLTFSTFWFIRFFRANDENSELVEKLQKEYATKDQFLVNTSLELRNPLHGMINMAQSITDRDGGRLTLQSKQNLELLMIIGRRMSYLVNDLINVTKMEQNKISLHKQPVALLPAITTVVNVQRILMDSKNLHFQLDIPNDFPYVYADETHLRQIMFNLLNNSVKYTENGVIAVEAKVKNKQAVIHIKDSGIGMDEETQKRVFLPYEKGAKERSDDPGGLGLGLSICQKLVTMNGGTLTVTSNPSKGSVFTFTLPLVHDEERIHAENSPAPTISQEDIVCQELAVSEAQLSARNEHGSIKPKILAVDDDPMNLHVLKNILSAEEYSIETVTSAEEVLNRLDEGWDLIIADVMMPTMSGYELTRKIRKHFSISELPVLLLTAHNNPEEVYTGFLAGANDYLVKPIDTLELRVRIGVVIDLKHSIMERLRMESAWLQSQIQPHFLFNTLNSIAALVVTDSSKMLMLLNEFSNYLRLSFDFNNAEPLVPLSQELSLVQSYLYIEKVRFNKRLTVNWELHYSGEWMIPPLTIQPLVENAVKHGILSKPEGGTISIKLSEEGNDLKVEICDDGKGISPEKQHNLFTFEKTEQKRGIGLMNVNRRLKQIYRQGLTIQSKVDQGTKVTFFIRKD